MGASAAGSISADDDVDKTWTRRGQDVQRPAEVDQMAWERPDISCCSPTSLEQHGG